MNFIAVFVLAFSLFGCATIKESEHKNEFRLDHVPIFVRDMNLAKKKFGSHLGFSLEDESSSYIALNSKLIPFQDGSFLRITAIRDQKNVQIQHLKDFLKEREGSHKVSIEISQWDEVRHELNLQKIPYNLSEHTNLRNESVYKKIAFPTYEPLNFVEFVYYIKRKNTEGIRHKNTTSELSEVWVVVEDIFSIDTEMAKIGLFNPVDVYLQPLRVTGKSYKLSRGQLIFVQRSHLENRDQKWLGQQYTELIGISIKSKNLDKIVGILNKSKKVKYATARYNEKDNVMVPPKYTHGLWVEFSK